MVSPLTVWLESLSVSETFRGQSWSFANADGLGATHFHAFIYLCDVLKVKSINFCYLEISKCCEEITCAPSLLLRQLFVSSLIFGTSFTWAEEVIRVAFATGCYVLGGAENFSLFQLPKDNHLILVVGPGFPIHACPPFPE